MPPFNMNDGNQSNGCVPPYTGPAKAPQSNNGPSAPMTFVEAITTCFNKYCDFNGRASRAEFWWWILFNFIVGFVCGLINQWLGNIASLALLLPNLGVCWRRLHDTGRAGGWWFINFIPLVGWILFIVWAAQPSEPQPNRFGNVPEK